MQTLKSLFTSNFATLSPKTFDLNSNTIKVFASYEDGEGGFYEAETILDAFAGQSDEEAVNNMLEGIADDCFEVEFKKEGNDYVITAGNSEAVYAIRLQIFRLN